MNVPVKTAKKAVPDYENKLNDFVVDNAESVVQIAYPDYNAVSAAAREAIDYSKENPEKFHHFELYNLRKKPPHNLYIPIVFALNQRYVLLDEKTILHH